MRQGVGEGLILVLLLLFLLLLFRSFVSPWHKGGKRTTGQRLQCRHLDDGKGGKKKARNNEIYTLADIVE